jgi:hypothetical protein
MENKENSKEILLRTLNLEKADRQPVPETPPENVKALIRVGRKLV